MASKFILKNPDQLHKKMTSMAFLCCPYEDEEPGLASYGRRLRLSRHVNVRGRAASRQRGRTCIRFLQRRGIEPVRKVSTLWWRSSEEERTKRRLRRVQRLPLLRQDLCWREDTRGQEAVPSMWRVAHEEGERARRQGVLRLHQLAGRVLQLHHEPRRYRRQRRVDARVCWRVSKGRRLRCCRQHRVSTTSIANDSNRQFEDARQATRCTAKVPEVRRKDDRMHRSIRQVLQMLAFLVVRWEEEISCLDGRQVAWFAAPIRSGQTCCASTHVACFTGISIWSYGHSAGSGNYSVPTWRWNTVPGTFAASQMICKSTILLLGVEDAKRTVLLPR